MSKRYNIRWTKNDSKDLSRAVRNFNAKVRRLEKKYADNPDVFLPERVTAKELKEIIGTRQDLQREIKSLQKFSKKGSEKLVETSTINANTDRNIKLTKWQRSEMQRRAKLVNDKRRHHRNRIEELELESGGKSLGYTRADIGMGRTEAVQLQPIKTFYNRMTRGDMREKASHLLRESQSDYWYKRDIMMRDNYIMSLEQNFNPNDVKEVVDKIRTMGIRSFKNKLYKDPDGFDTAYPTGNIEDEEKYLTRLKSIWIPKSKPTKGATLKKVGKK